MTGRVDLKAQKLAVLLIHQLAAIKKMPRVKVRLLPPNKSKPIVITPVPNETGDFRHITIWQLLSLDVDAAIAKGGSLNALLQSRHLKRPWPPACGIEAPDNETLDDAISVLGLKVD
jgi:hypothetical protein